ncbi:Hypothetical predicted protein [Mytilus galloprovincialis]|uniref:Uncharacterized protein n=1 Tax=Mytilus galloprovincialis TaxID=29158 RepID=A0A8B6CTW3_MYTGA|nr:Hypothetical predicted protein [Mytilus galloprovincialis]
MLIKPATISGNSDNKNIIQINTTVIAEIRVLLRTTGLSVQVNDASDTNLVSFPDPTQIITDRIDSECNGLPKNAFIASLLEICQNDTDTLEQLRLYYFKVAKCREDFPIQCPVLKRRVNLKRKTGEPLVNKLWCDCYALRLASRVNFAMILKKLLDLDPCRPIFQISTLMSLLQHQTSTPFSMKNLSN